MEEITFGSITKIRCGRCERAPLDLPLLDVREQRAPVNRDRLQPVRAIARMLPLDWKARRAGRDPGEDD